MCLATPYSAFFSKNPAPLNTRLFANHLLKESEKVGLKLSIQKTNIMASGPLTSWQIDGETMETVTNFFGGRAPKLQMMTAAMKLKEACSLEEKL